MATKKKDVVVEEARFTKAQLLSSKRFLKNRDLASVLLSDDVEYTLSEVSKIVENYMKGKVK